MEDNSVQASTKRFSFRKKRSNSKTRKDDEQKPVDIELNKDEINDAEIAKCGEYSGAESGDSPPRKNIDSEAEAGFTANEDEDAVPVEEDSSPKGVQSEASAKEPSKKKSKRRSRGLFRRSSKNKDAGKNAEACEGEAKMESVAHAEETKREADEAKASEVCTSDGKEQVAGDESGDRSEVGEQSDAEYAGNVSGAASECEEIEENDGEDGQLREDGVGNDKKKGEQKDGRKKKKFFKRGLSLRRSKSKKNQDGDEAKGNKAEQSAAPKETNEIGVSTDSRLDLSQFAAQGDQSSSANGGAVEISGKEHVKEMESGEVTKKAPVKPVRQVSFADQECITPGSSDDGDSPSEELTNKEKEELDSPEVPPPSAVETAIETDPNELPPIEAEAETKEPEEPKKSDVEDDDLTEVSSVTSSLVASSDAHSQADPDTEETGSRITLLDSVELGEGSKAVEDDGKEASKDSCECDKLLEEKQQENKDGEWIMLDQSCDVTGELQRMRKQTLFSVKRLCCSVM